MKKYNSWIEIDLNKINRNLDKVYDFAGNSNVMAVVKANAYGHGMLDVARFLAKRVNCFGVSSFSEALQLRENGILTPILILGSLMPYEFKSAIHHDLTVSVSELGYAEQLGRVAEEEGLKVKVHVKVDTGMGRWGVSYCDAYNVVLKIKRINSICLEGIFTHFSVADNMSFDYTDRQIELFKALIEELEKKKVFFSNIHAANSAGIINFKESHFSMVRPGMMIYGYSPHRSMEEKIVLEPALSFKSRVSLIKDYPPKRAISYGRKFLTRDATQVAVIPVGYSHGYPYALSQKGYVLINGERYPIAGTVCMDYFMVDLGRGSNVKLGDEVTLLGQDKEDFISAYELAGHANTIPYEIITNLNYSIPRVYFS